MIFLVEEFKSCDNICVRACAHAHERNQIVEQKGDQICLID